MRVRLPLLLLLAGMLAGMTGCATSPQALGLTGAAPGTPPQPPQDSTVGVPGLPDPDGGQQSGFGPTGMSSSGQRYYGQP